LFIDAPTGLIARNDVKKIKLFWNKDQSGTVTGYNVYRSLSSGSGYTKLNTSIISDTCYLNSALTNGSAYYYKITGLDKNGAESAFTAEVASTAGPVIRLQETDGVTCDGSVDSNYAGFNGTGFFNFATTNSYIDFSNIGGYIGGSYMLKYRYALGTGARTGTLTVNSVSQDLTMKLTMAWTTYIYDSILITLKPGFTNNIRFAVKSNDLGNLDEIIVRPVTITGVNDKHAPSGSQITGIYPNPFSDQTRIEYMISEHCSIKIEILDIMGQTVRVLTDIIQGTGEYEITWDGRNGSGNNLPEGIYFCRLVINNHRPDIKKIVVAGK